MRNKILFLTTLLGITTLAACGDAEEKLCTHNGVDIYESDGKSSADCYDEATGEMNAGPAIAAKIDIAKPFVDLGVLGADWAGLLGAEAGFTIWDPMFVQTATIGYNSVGGSDDYDPDHSSLFITKTLKVDVEGDGVIDKVYEAVPIPETPDGQFFMGTYVNVANDDCDTIGDDETLEYEDLSGCYAMYYEVCGAEFTAYDVDAANLGECSLSVINTDGVLSWGPEISTF